MAFPSKSGCPMCGIVSRAAAAHGAHGAPSSPLFSPTTGIPHIQRRGTRAPPDDAPDILWRDDNFTVYRERAHPVSSRAHLVIVFNLHVPSLYMLSSSDVPLLISLRTLAHRFLSSLSVQPPSLSPTPVPSSSASSPFASQQAASAAPLTRDPAHAQFRVGFVAPPWKDAHIPVKDHLHAHAYVAPADLCGWWRAVAYGPLAWYAVEDLIAEIREESTNNRVKSGYANRGAAPIDAIADAGARSGTSDGLETTEAGLAAGDLEEAGLARTPHTVLAPAPAARLAAPSHLDLSATLGTAPAPDRRTPTSTRSSFASASAGAGSSRASSSSDSRSGSARSSSS
ncbi:hypothetical protein DFH11DRAFT_1848035 [Phellopilus nigrolimitatus]|nr:hypothetical protein DFH11DRAFT_1848035 [Phellopilus nigrolimitatus]